MAQMQTMEKVKVAGFVDRGYNAARRQKKMDEDEAEIKRLEAELRGEKIEEGDEEVDGEEETQETGSETPESGDEDDNQDSEDTGKTLTAEERSFKKRYGDLRRFMQEKEKAWEAEKAKLLDAPKTVVPPKTDEDIDAWAKKYPDIAGIVQTIAKKQAEEMFASADSRLKDLDRIARETEAAKAKSAIRKAHSDFDSLQESDEFHDWAEAQPKWVQDALYENADDPASVIRVIDLYKADNGLTKAGKQDGRKAAAKDVSTRTTPKIDSDGSSEMIRESQVQKMSDKEFEENYEKIMKAQKTGKFIYDISGKAR